MKTIYALSVIVICGVVQQRLVAQEYVGVYGIRANTAGDLNANNAGTGAGINYLSKAKSFGDKVGGYRAAAQMGWDFSYSGLGNRTVYDVPLITPQVGLCKAKIYNTLVAVDLISRFSFPNKSIFTPFVGLSAGYRDVRSIATTTPYEDSYSLTGKSNERLTQSSQFTGGVSCGLVTRLSKKLRFDVEVNYSEAVNNGNMTDLSSAGAGVNGLKVNLINAPVGVITVKAGLLVSIDLSKYYFFKECKTCPTISRGGHYRVSTGWGYGNYYGGGSHQSNGSMSPGRSK